MTLALVLMMSRCCLRSSVHAERTRMKRERKRKEWKEGRKGWHGNERMPSLGFTIAHTLTHLDSNCFLLLSTHIAAFFFVSVLLKDNDGSLDA